jgi:predicted P-loop ATPase
VSTKNIAELAALIAAEPTWFKDCQLGAPAKGSKIGKPRSNLKNVLLALRRDPIFEGMFAFDLMECSAILLKPVALDPPTDFTPRPVTDVDITHLQERLQDWFPGLGKDTVCQALDAVAHEHAFHPIRDWLQSLQWDGKKRVGTWLHDYLGVRRTQYSDKVGEMFLVGMAARVMSPGEKNDALLVLEGKQGSKKSTALEVLTGEKWFTDSLPSVDKDRECSQHLAGKWLCEIPEMVIVRRAEVEKFKSFMSRRIERYRRPYDRKEVHEARQVVFAGTTNQTCYLRDETGNRRFLPVAVGEINIDKLRADRNMLFAEALVMFKAGAKWWPDADFEEEFIVPEQDARYESDELWEEPIATYLNGKADVTIKEVAIEALGFESLQRISSADMWRIQKILRRLEWTPGRRLANRRSWVPR